MYQALSTIPSTWTNISHSAESELNCRYRENEEETAEIGIQRSPELAAPMEVMALDFGRRS